jgi:hypothetical protein
MMPFFLLWGFLLWLGTTLLFRVAGQFLLNPDVPLVLLVTFAAAIPLVGVTTYPLYRWRSVGRAERLSAAGFIAVPGMLLDVFSISFASAFFPNLTPSAAAYFAAWVLRIYSLVLLTGFIPFQEQPA